MKKTSTTRKRREAAGSRIVASLREAVDWVDGKDVSVRVTTVKCADDRCPRDHQGTGSEPGRVCGEVWVPSVHF